jgi:hypothetical protein
MAGGAVVSYAAISTIASTVRKPQPELDRNHFPADRLCRLWVIGGAEGAMHLGIYTVVKEANEWTIRAGGVGIIACRDRRTAMRTVRRAAELLRRGDMARLASAPGEAGDSANLALQAAAEPAGCGYDFPAAADPS